MAQMPRRSAFILVLSHAVLAQLLSFAMRPTISYAVLDAGGSAVLLGVIAAAFALPALALALPVGHVMDRVGERPALIAGPLSFVAAACLAFFAPSSIPLLLLATVLVGLGHLMSVVGGQAVLANTTGGSRSDSVFGMYTFAASLGQTLGPLLLALPGGTVSTPPLQLIFLVCSGISVAMLLLSMFMKSSPRQHMHNRSSLLRTAVVLLKVPGVPRSLIATSIVLTSVDLFLAYTPALGHERALPAAVISTMLVARSAFSMLSRLFLGPMVRAVGRRRLVVWTISLSAVALGCLVLPLSAAWLIVLASVFGFMIGACQPITMSWISALAPPGTRGLAMSIRMAANRVGQTVLPVTLGAFAAATGAAGVLVATGVCLVGAAWSGAAVPNSPNAGDEDEVEPS